MSSITLSKITIYPIKSLAGIDVTEAELTNRGLKYDRRWMLIDEQNQLISQRNHPELCLLHQQITEQGIKVTHQNNSDLSVSIPFVPEKKTSHKVEIWGDWCEGVTVNDEVKAFFSDYLKIPCKLLFQPDEMERVIEKDNPANGHQTTFTDGYPYMILSEASLEDLNQRSGQQLKMNRFRPNFVLQGCEPFAEDTWSTFQLGNIVFHRAKPCVRCKMTTIEQETSKRHETGEPLRTLATYRRWENFGVTFGMNIAAKNLGIIKVGDILTV